MKYTIKRVIGQDGCLLLNARLLRRLTTHHTQLQTMSRFTMIPLLISTWLNTNNEVIQTSGSYPLGRDPKLGHQSILSGLPSKTKHLDVLLMPHDLLVPTVSTSETNNVRLFERPGPSHMVLLVRASNILFDAA